MTRRWAAGPRKVQVISDEFLQISLPIGIWPKFRKEERLLTEPFGMSYLKCKERVKALRSNSPN